MLTSALLITLALLPNSAVLSAQDSRAADKNTIVALIQENPGRANGNLCPYIAPNDVYTPAPRGYKPFYISHIARHGSRFHQSTGGFTVIDTLRAFDAAGMLTETGKEMLADMEYHKSLNDKAPGALTKRGREEHKGMCRRMVGNYGRVFKKRHTVNSYSTSTQRVLDSRESFLEELNALVPGLKVYQAGSDDPNNGMEVTGFKLTQAEKDQRNSIDARTPARALQEGRNADHFAKTVFKDPSSISADRAWNILGKCFTIGMNLANVDSRDIPDFYRYFTPEELYYTSIGSSPDWWLKHGDMSNPATGAERIGAGIARMIIADAEEALKPGSDVAATLRFSHDSYLLPVMSFMGLTSGKEYVDFENICAGCNVQLIFFRNRKGNVLVKILKNEHESLIDGLDPVMGPYYEWSALKAWMQGRSPLV